MGFIGIDLGTSAVKLLLMEQTGVISGSVSREYPLNLPKPGWSEQNPEDWMTAVTAGLTDLLADYDKDTVQGISFGGQMHGLVLLDAQDQVIRPAILWNDGRSFAESNYLNDVIGKEKLSEYTANISFAGFTASKLLWVKNNEPENFARISKIMLPKDYLAYRLTGVHATDVSDASGMLLFDVRNKCWSKEMMAICDVSAAQLPTIFESYEVIGNLKPEYCQQLSLPSQVKVAAGAGDNAAAAVGTGTVGEGGCTISLGTSGTVFISSKTFGVDPNNALHSFAHADGGYHLMGCILSAASCNKWWMDDILKTKDYQGEQQDITVLGSNQVFFLPYLMGERSPHNDADARGVFYGMSMNTTRAEMTQAVFEGVAFALRDCLEVARSLGLQIDSSKLCGGGAKSPLWRRILANVLNVRLDIVRTEEGPGYGAAMLAAVACGAFESVEAAAAALVEIREQIRPEPELVAAYNERYRKYREIYPALKAVFAVKAD